MTKFFEFDYIMTGISRYVFLAKWSIFFLDNIGFDLAYRVAGLSKKCCNFTRSELFFLIIVLPDAK